MIAQMLRTINKRGTKLLGLSLRLNNDRILDKLAEIALFYGIRYMSFYYGFDPKYGAFDGFEVVYQFIKAAESPGKPITVVAEFHGRKVKMSKTRRNIDDVDLTIFFKNGRTMISNLTDRDMFDIILHNEVHIHGNLNYLCKFGFLVNHMKQS